MGYTAWSVIFGEQPSASKWNILGTNDSGFRDGSNFALGDNVIPGNALTTTAIKLGSTVSTSLSQAGFSAQTDITGMSVTVTVPAGGRSLLILGQVVGSFSVAGDEFRVAINEGATILNANQKISAGAGKSDTFFVFHDVNAPSAGSHTYKLTGVRVSGTGTFAPLSGVGLLASITVYLV